MRTIIIPVKICKLLCGFSALVLYAGCILMPFVGRAGAVAPEALTYRILLTAVWTSGLLAGAGSLRYRGNVPALRRPARTLVGIHALLLLLLWTGLLGR